MFRDDSLPKVAWPKVAWPKDAWPKDACIQVKNQRWTWLLLPFLLVGCGRNETFVQPYPEGGVIDLDAQGADRLLDAAQDASVDAGGCVEGTLRCRSGNVEECQGGSFTTQETCPFGCVSSPTVHCGNPVFTNSITLDDVEAGINDLVLESGDILIDTDSGTITGPGTPSPGSYPYRLISRDSMGLAPLLLLSFREITVASDVNITVVGQRPLALVSWDRITIDGTIDMGSRPDGSPGPGGYAGGANGLAGLGPGHGEPGEVGILDFKEGGGGGGGFGGYGGSGGSGGTGGTAVGGQGGSPFGNPQLNPIVGGSGGGSGGKGSASTPGEGGSGGGALILVSLDTVQVGLTGILTAGGSGGQGGATDEAGGGGGSGGAFLIVGQTVQILGVLAANGGGGGGAETATVEDGESGRPEASAAAGGTHGGDGGADSYPAGEGGLVTTAHGGGGGGGVGRIRIESRDSPNLTGVLSPNETTSAVSLGTLSVE